MKNQTKKAISMLLVLVQLFVLFPVLQPQAKAAAQNEPETPVLNETIVGTVKFQSFNFLGDNATGEDGTDYSTTFYYSDDYFSPSAINSAATSKSMLWSDLDNPPLAACSMDFAVAAMTSADGDVLSATSRTWDNSDYSAARKEKNVRDFLSACGFADVECTELNKRPTNDSIGYTIGSKEITVWNADTQKNETYTLIAVGVRGAGYGQEWASNISIGDPATGAIPASGRHWGFDDGAKKVCSGISTYLREHGITGNVKYWITGFSRAAAVANLTAGYLTDQGSAYQTRQKDVFAYTWECPQAASTRENALNYKNIHNILNPMDAVPKVSPDAFEHQRLGVDYQMPYHGNASTSLNDTLYRQMFEVLKTIATGSKYTGKADPLVDDPTTNTANDGYVSPSKYPYNKVMTIYKMDAGELMGQVVNYGLGTNTDTLMKEFGTVEAEHQHKGGLFNLVTYGNVKRLLGWNGGTDYKTTTWYLDDFIESLVGIFLTSNAWVGGTGTGRTALQNRATFISDYQSHFRTLFGYFLDLSGPAFLDLVPKLIDAVTDNIGTSLTSGFAWDFVRFYNDPSNTSKKNNLIDSSKTLAVDVANDMAGTFSDAPYQGITKAQMNAAIQHLAELVVNLYSYELSEFDSQYLGTTLRYLNTILCVHEQETVLSWIMSLDQNHMNRSCRTITIPAGCNATLYEYRPEYEGNLSDELNPTAPVVAEVKNGALVSDTLKDQRIYSTTSNGNVVIRYPASLQIRADVTSDSAFSAGSVKAADYRTTNAYINVSNGKSQFETTTLNSSTGYSSVTGTSATNVTATNTALSRYGNLSAGDTLHIMADEITSYNANNTNTYTLLVDKAPETIVVDYAAASDLSSGTDAAGAVQLGVDAAVSSSTDNSRSIPTRTTTITVPASSIYFDDELTADSASGYAAETTRLDSDAEGKTVWYKFRGTRIDVYCTTDDTAGYVMAVTVNGERMISTMKSASDTTRYNVPTISFDGLDANTDYYLKIYALKGANYRLDGIRVYHPADETDSTVRSAYEAAGEQDANYVNLRALLLGSVSGDALSADGNEGALFYTDSGESYALTSDEYLNDSPKNEVYLKSGERVAFQIVGEYEKVAVGLSAPDSVSGGGSVTVTDGSGTKTLPIADALDQYYPVTPAPDGSVAITNTGSDMISITNVKLSGDRVLPLDMQSYSAPLMVSKSLMQYAAAFPELPAAGEPEPAPDISALVQQLISSFVQALFGSISRLFGG